MTAQYATLGGKRITSGSIGLPLFGLWSGDVMVSDKDPVTEQTALTIGNLTMKCAVYRTAEFAGSRACRIVGGAGGWRKDVAAKAYVNASGVSASMVLNDAAKEVGETVVLSPDRKIGPAFIRVEGPASHLLYIVGGGFYVDNAGITQVKAWPTKAVTSEFTVVNQNGATGRVEIATEDLAAWMPGATFRAPTLAGTLTNRGVVLQMKDDGNLRLEVLT